MLHSVGERVQGKQPETQFVFAEKQKDKSLQEMEESGRRMIEVEKWQTLRGRTATTNKIREKGKREQWSRKMPSNRKAQKGPHQKEAEGTPNFTWRRKEQHVFKCLIWLHSGLCECQVSGCVPIQLRYRYRNHQIKQRSCSCPGKTHKQTSDHKRRLRSRGLDSSGLMLGSVSNSRAGTFWEILEMRKTPRSDERNAADGVFTVSWVCSEWLKRK